MYTCPHLSVVKVHFSSTTRCGVLRKAGMFSSSVPSLSLAFLSCLSFLLTGVVGTSCHMKCCRGFNLGVTNRFPSLLSLSFFLLSSHFSSLFHLLSLPLLSWSLTRYPSTLTELLQTLSTLHTPTPSPFGEHHHQAIILDDFHRYFPSHQVIFFNPLFP